MAFPESMTAAERQAVKRVLLKIKRVWNAAPETADEDIQVDRLVDAVIELARETEK